MGSRSTYSEARPGIEPGSPEYFHLSGALPRRLVHCGNTRKTLTTVEHLKLLPKRLTHAAARGPYGGPRAAGGGLCGRICAVEGSHTPRGKWRRLQWSHPSITNRRPLRRGQTPGRAPLRAPNDCRIWRQYKCIGIVRALSDRRSGMSVFLFTLEYRHLFSVQGGLMLYVCVNYEPTTNI